MKNFKSTIGIEIHVELNTKSKMFSSAPNLVNQEPNTCINEIDLGLPGALPSPNEEAIKKAILLGKSIQANINSLLYFDRKNYFYQDLPKGYQITQHNVPIGTNGQIQLKNKVIRIRQIHLEEDTAKQIWFGDKLCLDFNRCGVPLIEIVTEPDIESAEQAVEFLNEIKNILLFLNISDAKLENGSFRADINISIAPHGSTIFGQKVEVKNINSFAGVRDAINYEIERQQRAILNNEMISQSTRRWDDVKRQTIFMREKSNIVDYRYFREPNITPINIKELVNTTLKNMPELPFQAKQRLVNEYQMKENFAQQIIDDYWLYKAFIYVVQKTNAVTQTINWVVNELAFVLKAQNKTYADCSQIVLDNIVSLIKIVESQEINNKQAKIVFENMMKDNKDPKTIIEKFGFKQITDVQTIYQLINDILDEDKSLWQIYKTNESKAIKLIIGLLMKKTNGEVNPIIANKVLIEILSNKNE